MRDAKDVFAYSRDEEVARHVLWSAQKELSEAKDYCKYMMRRYRADEPSSWGIIDKQTDRLVGTIGYMVTARTTPVWSWAIRWRTGSGTADT